jgi:TatD DNase family protein
MKNALVDTHCHLTLMLHENAEDLFPLPEQDLKHIHSIVDQARAHHIAAIITIGTNSISSLQAVQIAQHIPHVFASAAIHPTDIAQHPDKASFEAIQSLVQQKKHNKIIAIGECGLDFYHPGYNKDLQIEVFKKHIELALAEDLPLIIHSRNAIEETLATLEPYFKHNITGVFHCFSESLEYAQEIIKHNFYLGIGGTYTYPKNTQLRDIINKIGLSHIVLETDAPFLAPQAVRGTKNTPANITLIAQAIAQNLNISTEDVAQITTRNACKLFSIDQDSLKN